MLNVEKEKKLQFIVILIFLVSTLFLIQYVSALTASSENYSISTFETGMATANPSSTNYESTVLSEAGGTTRNAESDNYRVNIGFFDNTTYYRTVSITSYSISPSSAVIGSTINLYISALNAQSVWVVISRPDGVNTNLFLSNNDYTSYAPAIVGTYTITFYANSSTGAIASAVDSFTLTAQSTSPPGGGGNSGGTTTVIEKCTYNWDCTPWSVCSDGKQTRVCKNIGTCEGNKSKPVEEMECSESLFDIILKFKEIELIQNETLKFSVELTEVKSIEKIDVHIKYSIIDSKNNELWSQIETRAIQGNLIYEKEMSDMKLKDGNYILRVDILYGNLQRAFAEQKFIIKGKKISIEESISTLQKTNIFVLVAIGIIILFVVLLILYLLIKFRKVSIRLGKIERRRGKYKRKHLIFGFVALLIVALLAIILKTKITGSTISNLPSYSWKSMLIPFTIISLIVLLIVLRKKVVLISKKIIESLSESIKNPNKHPKNSIKGLINKRVYTSDGYYLGKVQDIILGENRIDNLKIKLNKKHKITAKGVIIKYRNIKSVGNIMIVDEKILEKLNISIKNSL